MNAIVTIPIVSMRGVGKSFGDNRVLADIDLDIRKGEVLSLIGPSGSGKTTLLRCMNFLEAYEAAQCVLCHKFGNDGGAVGPDLTAVSSRFNRHDILESIIEPSKVVSEQFVYVEPYLLLALSYWGLSLLINRAARALRARAAL